MKLHDLVALAKEKDPGFKKAYDYRVNTRRALPDFDWLMEGLELALGKEFLENAAQEEIERLEAEEDLEETNGNLSEKEES